MLAELTTRYPNEKAAKIAESMGVSVCNVRYQAQKLRLRKSKEFFASSESGRTDGKRGLTGRFQKGHQTWNKGINFPSRGRAVETQFKKGHRPMNAQPIGSYRITKDGLLQRKISNDKGSNSKRWRSVHELVWVEANGAVPKNHIVVFKKGMNTTNPDEITIDKVECISRQELMRRNTVHNLPEELAEVVRLRGVLNRKINSRSKEL